MLVLYFVKFTCIVSILLFVIESNLVCVCVCVAESILAHGTQGYQNRQLLKWISFYCFKALCESRSRFCLKKNPYNRLIQNIIYNNCVYLYTM